MSLYVRVMIGFYTHRKTIRLRALIGDSALWVPPRLWAYAAENQPDGCFKDFSASEIALLLGYQADACALLQALLKAGFMDGEPLRIHDWGEHNGYHSTFSERARKGGLAKAAKDRERKGKDKKGNERKGKERSQAVLEAETSTPGAGSEPEAGGFENREELVHALRWLADWRKNGADYTEAETKGALLALQASGWRWGRNPVFDRRAALERQIQTDRDRKHNGNSTPPEQNQLKEHIPIKTL